MDISEVRIKLMDDPNDRLQGFCSITFDKCFVIRDLKIIRGMKGSFVAMPSRKLTDRCPKCGTKNQLRARFCNDCGVELHEDRAIKDDEGRAKLYADIAHPINSGCRDMIQRRVLEAFEKEIVLAQKPGYRCSYDDYGEDRIAGLKHPQELEVAAPTPAASAETPTTPAPTSEGRTIRIDGPDGSHRRIEPAQPDVTRPHHLDAPDRVPSVSSDGQTKSEDDFGTGVV
ncbi:MAG: septation protein SpoVG family protein [Planctomycetales bacterium]